MAAAVRRSMRRRNWRRPAARRRSRRQCMASGCVGACGWGEGVGVSNFSAPLWAQELISGSIHTVATFEVAAGRAANELGGPMNGRATRAVRWAARGIASWSREGRRGRASEAEGVASVRYRRHVCVCGRCARTRAGAGRMRAPPALELDLLVRRAAQGRSRPRGARGTGRGRRPPPRKPLRSAACWICAGRCTIPGSCER